MLPEATFDMTAQAMNPGANPDSKLFVQFTMHPRLNTEKSAQEGRPIFEDREYIMIMVPGDATSIVHRPLWQNDLSRFPVQYAAFKNNKDQRTAGGTPLSAATFISAAQVRELEYFHCYTVEHLASLQDAHAGKFAGIQELKTKAKDFLAAAAGAAPLTAMRNELEHRDATIAQMQAQLAELMALQNKPKRGRKAAAVEVEEEEEEAEEEEEE